MVEAAGADLVDLNFGCPVKKVTKTGAGATLLDDPDRAARIVSAITETVDIPVSVKLRRGSRRVTRLPRRRAQGSSRRARRLTLHPRSAQQMYTGMADHALTGSSSRSSTSPCRLPATSPRAKAQAVLATTGAAP